MPGDKAASKHTAGENRVALRDWLILLAVMLLFAAGLGWQNGLGRIDQTIYDKLITHSGRPARDDIIIVAIDDYSLAQLGRWPWPRELHARLIDRLTQSRPRRIGLDIILSEPETSPGVGDALLQTAIDQSARVVLPVIAANRGQGLVATPPIPALAAAAFGLGHIALDIDRDGVTRSTHLFEGDKTQLWPHFSLKIGGENLLAPQPLPVSLFPPTEPTEWQRRRPILIPFSGGSGHFTSIPYLAVLRGEVPAAVFTDKYVLVGATAIGMADTYPTPVTGESGGMAGVEINANILAGLLDQKSLVPASPELAAIASCIPVLIALLCCYYTSPRTGLIVSGFLLILVALATLLLFRSGVWLPPAAACIALLMAYPLWSWRRLEAAINYLGREFQLLDREPHLLPEIRPAASISTDMLDRHIHAMEQAVQRVRDLRRFVFDSLNSLPDATLVTSVDGYVLLANTNAIHYFNRLGFDEVEGALLPYLFSTPSQTVPRAVDMTVDDAINWWNLLSPEHAATFGTGVEFRNHLGAELLVRSAPSRSEKQELTGWIVSIVDISAIRSAERSRDETLRFLSHDMRAPQASILALLELQNEAATVLPQAELFSRIEKASRRTLGLADNFVQLARAESHEYRLEEVAFHDIVYDATDEMWSLAKSRHITIQNQIDDDDCSIRVDRGLITRALGNLLSNAINYSPSGSTITCSLHTRNSGAQKQIICSVSDQGVGIADADQGKLFHRFQRVESSDQPRHDGIGLGLVFVKTVVERHHGTIEFVSKLGVGTIFTITLPTTAHHATISPLRRSGSEEVDPKL